jgi:hypothetical protein
LLSSAAESKDLLLLKVATHAIVRSHAISIFVDFDEPTLAALNLPQSRLPVSDGRVLIFLQESENPERLYCVYASGCDTAGGPSS